MKTSHRLFQSSSSVVLQKQRKALARIELLAVLLALAVLAVVALPALATTNSRSRVAQCFNNLRQVGRASQAWASQHGDMFPWHVRPEDGGLRNAPRGASPIAANPYIHFSITSNELGSPHLLVCPSDFVKKVARDFSSSSNGGLNYLFNANNSVSYFVGIDATPERPRTLLSGDRNVKTSRNKECGTVFVPATSMDGKDPNVGFTNGMHRFSGQIGLADGSVHIGGSSLVRQLALNSGDGTDAGAIGGAAPNNDILVPGQPVTIPE